MEELITLLAIIAVLVTQRLEITKLKKKIAQLECKQDLTKKN